MTPATDPYAWPADTTPNPDLPIPFTLTAEAYASLDEDGTAAPAVDLRQVARHLEAQLSLNRRPGITDANQLDVQALCVAEEAGELVGAYRRWAGKARRTGTRRELEDEVADVLIVTASFAERAGIDLNAAVAAKLTVIYSRGWREETPAVLAEQQAEDAAWGGRGPSASYAEWLAEGQPGLGEWGCARCGTAFFGTPPEDGLCPACRPAGVEP